MNKRDTHVTGDELVGDVTGWRSTPKSDTGWHIVFVTDDDGHEHTVTGCSLPRVGARVTLRGAFEDTRYGRQFHARSVASSVPPLSADGVARWLRERVPGIGPARARAMLDYFRGDAAALWAALEHPRTVDWAKLDMSPDLIRSASEALAADGTASSYQALLYGWGLTARQVAKVKAHWPELSEATVLLNANPYLLADHVDGFGFHRADAVAARMGIGPTDPVRLNAAVLHYLEAALSEGHVFADRAVMHAIARESRVSMDRLLDTVKTLKRAGRVIVEDGARVYLPELHAAECTIARDLRERFAAYPRTDETEGWSDVSDVRVIDMSADGDTTADPWQARAIDALADLSKPIVFVTGGPGTGKTTVLKQALTRLDGVRATVHLAAPTGKAAKRMIEATGRQAHTLHSLLGYRPQSTVDCDVCRDAESSFDYGRLQSDDADKRVIVVDESSMVDVRLWSALVDAAGASTCLRFVGDAHQLPPVGGGQPFRDALDVAPSDSVVRLRTVFRSKGEWIKAAAPTVLAGQVPPLEPAPGLRVVSCATADDVVPAVINVFGGEYDDEHFSARLATAAGHMPVLVPQRTGRAGANAINNAMHELLNPAPEPPGNTLELEDGTVLRAGSWVMLIKNNMRKRVCNGDTGFVTSVDETGAVAVNVEGSDAPELIYTRGDARAQIRLAYASTVHKAQGSEYPWCIVVCHSTHRRMLTRRLLYTAITRASHGVVLVGDRDGVEWAIGNAREVARCSWLKQRVTT